MKKAFLAVAAISLLVAPFGVLPSGWNRGLGTLCLKESLVFGFALLGYYWAFSALAGWIWRRLATNPARERFPAFMAVGVAIAITYTWLMTNWDWDVLYLWSACPAG